jgi:hypothetical protein
MSKLPAHLQHLTEELPVDKRAQVEEAMLSSPFLMRRMAEEDAANRLEHVRIQAPEQHSGGHYNQAERAIYLDPGIFTEFPERKETLDRIAYVLGHEVGHSGMSENRTLSLKDLNNAASKALWTDTGNTQPVDLTNAAEHYLQSARRDESLATISAWNALADRVDQENPGKLSREKILERVEAVGDCVKKVGDSYILAPDITLNPEQRIIMGGSLATSANIEAVAKCYYDTGASLGRHGDSNYTHVNGTTVIETIAAASRHYERKTGQEAQTISLDFQRLGLEREQLERNGLNLGGENFTLMDIGPGRRVGMRLKHDPDAAPEMPPIEATRAQAAYVHTTDALPPLPLRMTDPDHPLQPMHTQTMAAMQRSPDATIRALTGEAAERVAASLVAHAMTQDNAFKTPCVDHVAMSLDGNIVFAVHGGLNDPGQNLAYLPLATALATSVEKSTEHARTAAQTLQQEQTLALTRANEPTVDAPIASGPVMRMGARTLSMPSGDGASSGGGELRCRTRGTLLDELVCKAIRCTRRRA